MEDPAMNSQVANRGLLYFCSIAVCCVLTACGSKVKDRSEEIAEILRTEGITSVTSSVQVPASGVKTKRDEGGFVIQIHEADFAHVVDYMEQVLGTPSSGLGTNVNGLEGATFDKGAQGTGFLIQETLHGVEVIGIK